MKNIKLFILCLIIYSCYNPNSTIINENNSSILEIDSLRINIDGLRIEHSSNFDNYQYLFITDSSTNSIIQEDSSYYLKKIIVPGTYGVSQFYYSDTILIKIDKINKLFSLKVAYYHHSSYLVPKPGTSTWDYELLNLGMNNLNLPNLDSLNYYEVLINGNEVVKSIDSKFHYRRVHGSISYLDATNAKADSNITDHSEISSVNSSAKIKIKIFPKH